MPTEDMRDFQHKIMQSGKLFSDYEGESTFLFNIVQKWPSSDCRKMGREVREDCQKMGREVREDCQKIGRELTGRLPEDGKRC